MIRFSLTEPHKTPFTISKLTDPKKGTVNHHRVCYSKYAFEPNLNLHSNPRFLVSELILF